MAKSKPSAILYKNNKLEIHTEIHEKSVALNRDIVNFAIYSLIVTILTNVCNTKLITNFKVELVVFCANTDLESHIGTLQACPLFLIKSTNLNSLTSFTCNFCFTAHCIRKVRTKERKNGKFVNLETIFNKQRNFQAIVTYTSFILLTSTLSIIQTAFKEDRSRFGETNTHNTGQSHTGFHT